ncbi:MAG: elongation factor P [Candidatus Woykebacteria bacterium]
MIPVNELRAGTNFKEENDIFEVVSYQHTKIGRGSANIKIKARNLKTGQLLEKTFMSGARVEEAETEKKKLQFLYLDAESASFMDQNTFEQVSIPLQSLVGREKYFKEGEVYEVLLAGSAALSAELPKQTVLKVIETGPGVKGDTVSSVYKPSTLENGLMVNVPMFIKIGDLVRVDTRTGEYVERAKS